MSQNGCRILPIIGDLPEGFDDLLAEALQGGHEFVLRFHARWAGRAGALHGEHEGLFAAFLGERFVGMAAIGPDP